MASPSFSSVFLLLLIILYSSLSLSSSSLPLDEVEEESDFAYLDGRENGPKNWGNLEWEGELCRSGKMQSPIDLTAANGVLVPSLGELKINYIPAPAVLKNRGDDHNVMIEWTGDGGYIQIDGTQYNVVQYHWHIPSEHLFNGTRLSMEFHMLHRSSDGKMAVVGITYKFGPPDLFLSKVIALVGQRGNVTDLGIIDARELRFGTSQYYRYMGSLTTPPCTEGVIWTVMKKVMTVSEEQVKAMREAGIARTARPIQDLNGRPVWFYQG